MLYLFIFIAIGVLGYFIINKLTFIYINNKNSSNLHKHIEPSDKIKEQKATKCPTCNCIKLNKKYPSTEKLHSSQQNQEPDKNHEGKNSKVNYKGTYVNIKLIDKPNIVYKKASKVNLNKKSSLS